MLRVLEGADALARAAAVEVGGGSVGAHLGMVPEAENAASHRFAATLPGYQGWEWNVVVATYPGGADATVSELALLPGPGALLSPEWVPWEDRVRPGDLSPGDLLAPHQDDYRLAPGYTATGDPAVDEVAFEVGLGRRQVLSLEGRNDAAARWFEGDYGPEAPMAKAAPSTCQLCGFFLPLAGALRREFGVCGNEMSADGRVVHASYGCGAHSDTALPTGAGSPQVRPYDDGAVEVVVLTAAVVGGEGIG